MYAALWRALPGPVWLRIILLTLAVVAVLYGLFFHVFPWVSQVLTPTDSTIGG